MTKVYIEDLLSDSPRFCRVDDGLSKTVCGRRLRWNASCGMIMEEHAEKFASKCEECYDNGAAVHD